MVANWDITCFRHLVTFCAVVGVVDLDIVGVVGESVERIIPVNRSSCGEQKTPHFIRVLSALRQLIQQQPPCRKYWTRQPCGDREHRYGEYNSLTLNACEEIGERRFSQKPPACLMRQLFVIEAGNCSAPGLFVAFLFETNLCAQQIVPHHLCFWRDAITSK